MNKLDLHGVKHDAVVIIVENYVLLQKTPLKIITGCSDKMIELATYVLKKYRFKYFISSHNPGMITVLGGEKYEAK